MKYEKSLILRILLALVLLLIPFNIFSFFLTDLSLWSTLPLIKILGYNFTLVKGSILLFQQYNLEFAPACVATPAYYLLALMIILTRDIRLKQGISMFLLGSLLIFLMNIIRIDFLLIILAEFNENLFNKFHLLFWHIVSSIYVAGVWIFLTYKFKIKNIPIYSDLKYLYSKSLFFKRKKLKNFNKKQKHKSKEPI